MKRDSLVDKNVLVVGGAGFIGSHLVDRLYDEKVNKVIVLDNMFLGDEKNLASSIEKGAVLYKDDAEFYSTLEYIFAENEIDVVYNCATKALNYSFKNAENAFRTNINVIINLLELLRKGEYSTLCHFSTSEVYGTAIYEPMDENHPKNPTTTYAGGKAAADIAVETYTRIYNLDTYIVRPFNNYGPRQNYKGYLAGVIPITIKKILEGHSPEIHGTGDQSRDFIFVYDTVDAVIKLHTVISSGESVNISTDSQLKISEVIKSICNEMSFTGNIIRKGSRKSDVFCHCASNDKIKRMIDYNLTSFKVGLKETIEWYKENIEVNNDKVN